MSAAHRITVAIPGRAYDVLVGTDMTKEISEFVELPSDVEKAAVVTHPELRAYAEPVAESLRHAGLETTMLELSSGEGSKSLESTGRLLEELASAGFHRHDVLVALGGGVITDVGGFVASTYARGMNLVHVPTTLLGQVDAAIGGKTGVNLTAGKNLVGTIYQPTAVICDVVLLATCPPEEIRSGLAEVIKYGFIADPGLLDIVETSTNAIVTADPTILVDLVARCCAIKGEVVAADERESNIRARLNYGHTFAHAIEKTEGFGAIRHGEAVALGMMAAAYLARELDRIDDDLVAHHRRVIDAAGLPTSASLDLERLQDAWNLDKKYRGGVRFVLLSGLARPEVDVAVPPAALAVAVERLRS